MRSTEKRVAIGLLRFLFGLKQSKEPDRSVPRSIALFAQERFGDVIMMSALIRSLHKAYPKCEISIISVNTIADYMKYDPTIKCVLKAKYPSGEVKNILKHHEFDILFNTKDHPSVTFLYLSGRIKAKQKIGISHPDHRGFFDHLLTPPVLATTVQNYLSLLDYLKIPYTAADFIPYLPAGPVSKAIEQFSQTLNGQTTIAINLSASQTYKEWPVQKWSAFLKEITQPAIIIAMPKHCAEKKELEKRFTHVIPSPPTTTIFEAAQLIRYSQSLLSPDTALIHIASCYNIPVVALYRQPLDLQKFPPFSMKQQVLMATDAIISDIPVDKVLAAYKQLIS